MNEKRKARRFELRPPEEQAWICENTWCDTCQAADLGMALPREYEQDGQIYVEGVCRRCGQRVVSELNEGGA